MKKIDIICVKEAISSKGKKLMEFTLGESYTYENHSNNEEGEMYHVVDDNANVEVFLSDSVFSGDGSMFKLKTED